VWRDFRWTGFQMDLLMRVRLSAPSASPFSRVSASVSAFYDIENLVLLQRLLGGVYGRGFGLKKMSSVWLGGLKLWQQLAPGGFRPRRNARSCLLASDVDLSRSTRQQFAYWLAGGETLRVGHAALPVTQLKVSHGSRTE
jgi:hypothetical protein